MSWQSGRVRTTGAGFYSGKVIFLAPYVIFPRRNVKSIDKLHVFPLLSNLIKFYQITKERWRK
jgi:hypothetical protein